MAVKFEFRVRGYADGYVLVAHVHFYWYFVFLLDFWSFVHFQRYCMVLGIYERSGACATV